MYEFIYDEIGEMLKNSREVLDPNQLNAVQPSGD